MGEFLGEFICGSIYGAIAFPLLFGLLFAMVIGLNSDSVIRKPSLGWMWVGGILVGIPAILFLITWPLFSLAEKYGITLAVHCFASRYGSSPTFGVDVGVLLGAPALLWILGKTLGALSDLWKSVASAMGPSKKRMRRNPKRSR